MVWFTADSSLSTGNKGYIPFLKKAIELLELYEVQDTQDPESKFDVVVYAKSKTTTFVIGHNLQSKELELGWTDEFDEHYFDGKTQHLDWTNLEGHEITQVGFRHFCRNETSILWEKQN